MKGKFVFVLAALLALSLFAVITESDADGNAPTVTVEGVEYPSIIEAYNACSGMSEIRMELSEGDFDLRDAMTNKKIVITGEGQDKSFINIDLDQNQYFYDIGISFENLTINGTYDYFVGFRRGASETYSNVTINTCHWVHSAYAEFNNCIFNTGSNYDEYVLRSYGANEIRFDNCVFNTEGKAILAYRNTSTLMNVYVNDTKFYDTYDGDKPTGKAAIELHTESETETEIPINLFASNCEAKGFTSGPYSKSILWSAVNNTNKPKTESKNSLVIVDGITELVPVGMGAVLNGIGYETLAEALNAAKEGDWVMNISKGSCTIPDAVYDKKIKLIGNRYRNGSEIEINTLTATNAIPGFDYSTFVLSDNLSVSDGATFADCDFSNVNRMTVLGKMEILPGCESVDESDFLLGDNAVVFENVKDDDGKFYSGIVLTKNPDMVESTYLLEECKLFNTEGNGYEIRCPIKLESMSTVYVAFGSDVPDLQSIPVKEGFTFGGYWLESQNSEGKQYFDSDGNGIGTWDLLPYQYDSLKAHWTESPYHEETDDAMRTIAKAIFVVLLVFIIVGTYIVFRE